MSITLTFAPIQIQTLRTSLSALTSSPWTPSFIRNTQASFPRPSFSSFILSLPVSISLRSFIFEITAIYSSASTGPSSKCIKNTRITFPNTTFLPLRPTRQVQWPITNPCPQRVSRPSCIPQRPSPQTILTKPPLLSRKPTKSSFAPITLVIQSVQDTMTRMGRHCGTIWIAME
jgi:hypothetical protein